MSDPVTGGGERAAEQVAYFVIRIRRDVTNPAAGPTGTLERLGSGRARHFSGAEELLYLLTGRTNESHRSRRTGSE